MSRPGTARALAVQIGHYRVRDDSRMLQYTIGVLAAALTLAAAVYVQLRLQRFTANAFRLTLARTILFAVGLGCGYVGAQMYRGLLKSSGILKPLRSKRPNVVSP